MLQRYGYSWLPTCNNGYNKLLFYISSLFFILKTGDEDVQRVFYYRIKLV
jgi:hypothetical protein